MVWQAGAARHIREGGRWSIPRGWDHRMAADSTAATVFQYAWRTLLDMTYGDKLGEWSQPLLGGAGPARPFAVDRGFALRNAVALAASDRDPYRILLVY